MNQLVKVRAPPRTLHLYLSAHSNQYAVTISFNHIKGISALKPALEPVAPVKAAVPVPVPVPLSV